MLDVNAACKNRRSGHFLRRSSYSPTIWRAPAGGHFPVRCEQLSPRPHRDGKIVFAGRSIGVDACFTRWAGRELFRSVTFFGQAPTAQFFRWGTPPSDFYFGGLRFCVVALPHFRRLGPILGVLGLHGDFWTPKKPLFFKSGVQKHAPV